MKFLANLILAFNQLIQAVLHRVTNANQATEITTRGQIGYNDTVEKIIYHNGTAIQTVASEAYVATQVTAGAITVAPASQNLLEINAGQLSVKSLLIQKTFTNTTSTTLTLALAARTPVYNATNVGNGTADLQEGDVLVLAAATGGMQVYIHNGGTAGTTADFTLIETPNLDNAAIRALLSASNGVVYNPTTGNFTLDTAFVQALFNFTGGLNRTGNDVRVGGTVNGGSELVVTTSTFNVRNSRGAGYGLWLNNDFLATSARLGDASVNIERNDSGMQFNGLGTLGVTYAAAPSAPSNNTLIHKGYVDAIATKRSTQTVNTVANTFLIITHNFALADKDAIQVGLWEAGKMVMAEVETLTANTIQIRTGSAITGLKVFLIA